VAARGAARRFAGALVNAAAMAQALSRIARDVTLLCAGTNGEVAPEDLVGAGAVVDHLINLRPIETDEAVTEALGLFRDARNDLVGFLRSTQGGKNVLDADLSADIDFAAHIDVFDVVSEVSGDPPIVRVMHG
jgi:2-phosphosulfolactate phosphatase